MGIRPPILHSRLLVKFDTWRRIDIKKLSKNANATETTENVNRESPPIFTKSESFLYVANSRTPFTVEPDLDFRHIFYKSALSNLVWDMKNRSTEYRRVFSNDKLRSMAKRYLYEFLPAYEKRVELMQSKNKDGSDESDTDEETKAALHEVNNKIKAMKPFLLECLKIPNTLDGSFTPLGSLNEIVKTFLKNSTKNGEQSSSVSPCYYQFLTANNMLKIASQPDRLYLVGKAAETINKMQRFLKRKLSQDFKMVSPPHFVRSAVVEALGINCFDSSSRKLSANKLLNEDVAPMNYDFVPPHLVGHGLASHLAMFVGKSISLKSIKLPFNFFSVGMKYDVKKPTDLPDNAKSQNFLMNHYQRPVVCVTCFSLDKHESMKCMDYLKTAFTLILTDDFKIDFVIQKTASRWLNFEESRRLSFTSFLTHAPHLNLAYISGCDDFLSKRLRIYAAADDDDGQQREQYVHVTYGEIDLYFVFAKLIENRLSKQKPDSDSMDDIWKMFNFETINQH